MKVDISIIVAVYNADRYLKKCLASISAQTFENYEVLLVNDGSTDNSGIVCDEYALQDSRYRVFHQSNGGVSSARNVGISNAAGKYSIHIDPDDYVEPTYLEELITVAELERADIVICDFKVISQKGSKIISKMNFETNKDAIEKLLMGKVHGSVWNKLIKHSLYSKFGIRFPEDIFIGEDLFVVISLLLRTEKIHYHEKVLYNYVQHPISITNQRTESVMKNQMFLLERLQHLLNNKGYEKAFREQKVQIRRDAYLFNNPSIFNIKEIFPETDSYILKSRAVPIWLRICMFLEIRGLDFLRVFVFKLIKHR